MTLMAITGMGQMPIFKRYYVADLPGLAWLADPFMVHWIHYIGAALLMLMLGWIVTTWAAKRPALTCSGLIRSILLLLIVVTGYLRVMKNLPDLHWSPLTTMLIDWTHLLFAMLLGITALWSVATGRKAYIKS